MEAIKRAEEHRGRKQVSTVTGIIRGGKTELDRALERYTAERRRAKITDEKGFKDGTAKGVTQAVTHFQTVMGITDPGEITSKAVSEFYRKLNGTALLPGNQVKLDTTHKKSEATARTYATRVATFARWFGIEVAALKFKGKTPARKTVIPLAKVEELLVTASGDLKFVLLAGFRVGMRRGEIVWARPSTADPEIPRHGGICSNRHRRSYGIGHQLKTASANNPPAPGQQLRAVTTELGECTRVPSNPSSGVTFRPRKR